MTDRPSLEFYVRKDAAGEWRGYVRDGGNYEPLWSTTEGYDDKVDALHAAKQLTELMASGSFVWIDRDPRADAAPEDASEPLGHVSAPEEESE